MIADPTHRRTLAQTMLAAAATSAIGLAIAGCGSGGNKPVVVNPTGGLASMPTPSAATSANTYSGTDSLGIWSLHLDDTAKTYSYSDSTGATPAASGSFAAQNGFLSLGSANGVSLGYILEVPSRLAILRAGGPGSPVVVSVPQTSCYSIPYLLRFEYFGMDESQGFGAINFGSVVASSSTDGSTWQYESLTGSSASGPASFSGTCATASSLATLGITGDTLFTAINSASGVPSNSYTVSTSLAIGPSGFWVANQVATDTAADGFSSSFGTVGMAEPSTALTTSAAYTGTYLGLVYENGTAGGTGFIPAISSPVAFTPTTGGTTSLTGGVFPNDDVTQTPNTDTVITLGTQSSSVNGYYPSATITKPDPNQTCYTTHASGVGTNAAGFPICTFPATAIVSAPEGKYAIFLTAVDYTAGSVSLNVFDADMQIYLYQQ